MKPKFFELAKKVSRHSEHSSHKIGAVLVKRNKVMGVGFNKIKTHPKSNHSFKMIHAELSAILNASKSDLNGCSIYVYRETKDNLPANSKPCLYCQRLLKDVGIREAFHTGDKVYEITKLQ